MKLGTLVRLDKAADCTKGFEKLKEMGFETCQLVYKPAVYHQSEAEFIRAEADRLGIEITAKLGGFHDSFNAGGKFAFSTSGLTPVAFQSVRLEYAMRSVDFTRWLGITDNIFHAGFIPNDPLCDDYIHLVSAMKILCGYAKSVDANILYETGTESPISLLNVIEDVGTGNLFINFDTSNCITYGYGNPVDAIYTFGPYIRNMHAKDGMPPNRAHCRGYETPIGEGAVDFPRVFQRLHEIGYDGAVTIEREISGPQQEIDILRSAEYLRSLM